MFFFTVTFLYINFMLRLFPGTVSCHLSGTKTSVCLDSTNLKTETVKDRGSGSRLMDWGDLLLKGVDTNLVFIQYIL